MPVDPADIATLIALLGHKKHARHWDTRADEIRAQLDSGADPDAGPVPPLLWAARIGHLEIARVLLDAGADVHGGKVYHTPLHAAGRNNRMRSLLLGRGGRDTVFSLLVSGDAASVSEGLQRDPEVAEIRDETDRSLLFHASALHDLTTMRLLLDFGADPNHVNRTGKPVVASASGAEIRRLLEAHA